MWTRTLPIQTLPAAMPPARQNSFDPILCCQVFFLQCCQEASMASSKRILVCLCLQSYRSSFCWLESSRSPSLGPTLYLWWSLSFHIFTAAWNTENCASARPPHELLPTCRLGKRTPACRDGCCHRFPSLVAGRLSREVSASHGPYSKRPCVHGQSADKPCNFPSNDTQLKYL